MVEAFLASWVSAPWAVIIVAYAFGVVTGWLIWSRQAAAYDAVADPKTPADLSGDSLSEAIDGTDPQTGQSGVAFASATQSRFVVPSKGEGDGDKAAPGATKTQERGTAQEDIVTALSGELKKAYEAMASIDIAQAGQTARLNEVDQALKRANGRLKRIHGAIDKIR